MVSSLLIEGESMDFTRAREVLESRSPTSATEQMTMRFLDKYQWIHDTPSDGLPDPSVGFLTGLHGELFAGMEEYLPGRLKVEPNGIKSNETGQFTFECTPPRRTPAELEALEQWYLSAKEREVESVVVATWFAEFEAIHRSMTATGDWDGLSR